MPHKKLLDVGTEVILKRLLTIEDINPNIERDLYPKNAPEDFSVTRSLPPLCGCGFWAFPPDHKTVTVKHGSAGSSEIYERGSKLAS